MAATRLEGHWSGFMWLRGWTRQLIEGTIERQDAATRPRTERDANLAQGGVDPELAQLWVLLQLAHFIHRAEVSLPGRLLGSARFIRKSGHSFLDPTPKSRVNRLPACLEIGCNTGDTPPFGVEADHRHPTFRWVENIAIPGVAAPSLPGCWTCGQDVLDRVSAGATT